MVTQAVTQADAYIFRDQNVTTHCIVFILGAQHCAVAQIIALFRLFPT